MASVTIDRAPICSDPADEVPPKWRHVLIEERRKFCKDRLPMDCRMLAYFVEDGEKANWVGYSSREAYLSEGLQLDPDIAKLAIEGLKLCDPERATKLKRAVVLGKHGGDRKSADRDQGAIGTLKRGNSAAYTLARLQRDHPKLYAQVVAGKLSANAAAIKAGFRAKLTPLQTIVRLLPKLSDTERSKLLGLMGAARPAPPVMPAPATSKPAMSRTAKANLITGSDGALGPGLGIKDVLRRSLEDLPDDLSPYTREVAVLTLHRSVQAEVFQPIMDALKKLEAQTDWSGGHLIIEHHKQTWKDAPFKHYKSFADFYAKELKATWGKWEGLERTWNASSRKARRPLALT